jgi:hypothetical protein
MRRTRSSNPLLRSLCFSVSKYTETSVVRVGAPRVRGRKLELYFDFFGVVMAVPRKMPGVRPSTTNLT